MTSHRMLRAAYVAVPMLLVLIGEADPNHPRPPFVIAALVLCLPAIVATMPLLYIGLAGLWSVTDADHGGAAWPLTLAWVLVIGATAVCNLLLLDRWRQRSVAARS